MYYHNVFIVVFSLITILVFHHHNKYKNMERWFYRNNKHYYIALQISYYLLVISLVMNGRFLVYKGIEYFMKRKYGIKMKLWNY